MLPWLKSPPALLLFFLSPVWPTLSLPRMLAATAADAHGGGQLCAPALCGNVSIRFPFGIVPEQATRSNCGAIGFQVHCSDNTPYLGYNQRRHRFLIRDIFYNNASLLLVDIHKIQDLHNNSSVNASCRIPTNNSSTKLAEPFSISPLNQELIFYNCSDVPPPGKVTVDEEGLVGTVCRNNTFVRAGGRYGDESGKDGSYFLEGCNATFVPVLRGFGNVMNASNYLQLLRDGFLVTWQPPPAKG